MISDVRDTLYEPSIPRIPAPEREQRKRDLLKLLRYFLIFVSIMCLFLVVWFIWPNKPCVQVVTGVECEVFLNGESIGVGFDFKKDGLPVGELEIKAVPVESIPFKSEEIERLSLKLGSNETLHMLDVGQVEFITYPADARIIVSSVDGDLLLGTTPHKTCLPAGYYEVNLRLPGYPEYKQSIMVTKETNFTFDKDLENLALTKQGAKRLNNNLIISELKSDTHLEIDGVLYDSAGTFAIEPGFHNTCLKHDNANIVCADVMYPSVGKPVTLSCPENLPSPCLYFGDGLYPIPTDARDVVISEDGGTLYHTSQYNMIYEFVNAVDLNSGKLKWRTNIVTGWDYRPVTIADISGGKVYGMAGVPGYYDAKPFVLDIENGIEETLEDDVESILPLTNNQFDFGGVVCWANVWESKYSDYSMKSSIEAVIKVGSTNKRFIKKLSAGESAKFLGCSVGASGSNKPIFVFLSKTTWSQKLLILDPLLQSLDNSRDQPEWKEIGIGFEPMGVIFDKGFDTGKSFIIYSPQMLMSISYPSGAVRWRRYVNIPTTKPPTLVKANGIEVVLMSFDKSPFELQLGAKNGEEIVVRREPITEEETIGGAPAGNGTYIIDGKKVLAGIWMDETGKYAPRWEKTFEDGFVFASDWGPIHVTGNRFDVLGSHGIEPLISFIVPGFELRGDSQVFTQGNHIIAKADRRMWIIDKDGLLKGYFTNVDGITITRNGGFESFIPIIGGQRVVLPSL